MKMPGFTADQSLVAMRGSYRGRRSSGLYSGAVTPAIPPCRNCDYILEQCEKRGDYHSALCVYCELGYCDPWN